MYASASKIRQQTARLYEPPSDISVFDAATSIITGKQGPMDANLSPYMREPTNAMAQRRVHKVVFAGPGRCSKTFFLVTGGIAHSVVYNPGDSLVVCSSQDSARYYSKHELGPVLDASPDFAAHMSKRKMDDNTYDKLTAAGAVIAIAWPSGSQLSMRTFRDVYITEYDSADEDIEGEGSLDALASKRAETYLSAARIVIESSIRRTYRKPDWRPDEGFPHMQPPVTGITGLYNSGTRKWYYWRCPHCAEWMALNPDVHVMFNLPTLRELIEILPGMDAAKWARDNAKIPCRSCGGILTEDMRRDLNLGGRWVPDGCRIVGDGEIIGEPPESDIDSYQLSSVAAAYARWDKTILEKYAVAIQNYARTGEEADIQSTVNLDQGRAHLSLSVVRKSHGSNLEDRATGDWPQGYVPEGVRFLTASVDVQAGKQAGFVIKVTGWGRDLQKWPIDRWTMYHSKRIGPDGKQLQLDPASYPEDWHRLIEDVLRKKYPLADGSRRVMGIRFTTCDSGGASGSGEDEHTSVTSNAYDFHRTLESVNLQDMFRLVKGASSDAAPRWRETTPDASKRGDRNSGAAGDVPVIMINTTIIKDTLKNHLDRETIGPYFHHYPRWYLVDEHGNKRRWFDERTAEVRGEKRWDKVSARNEEIDLDVYAYVAALRLKADLIDWAHPPAWAESWDRNSLVVGSDRLAPPPAPVPFRGRRTRNPGVSIW